MNRYGDLRNFIRFHKEAQLHPTKSKSRRMEKAAESQANVISAVF